MNESTNEISSNIEMPNAVAEEEEEEEEKEEEEEDKEEEEEEAAAAWKGAVGVYPTNM